MLWLKTENTNKDLEVSIKVHVKGETSNHTYPVWGMVKRRAIIHQ